MYRNIDPNQAQQMLSQDDRCRYLDVRTVEEFNAGYPAGAWNIPLLHADPTTGQRVLNGQFLQTVMAHFPPDAPLVIGCQSGGRSAKAAQMLVEAGYQRVYNMAGGYGGARDQFGRLVQAGWRELGLPVETAAPAERTYEVLKESV